MTIHPKSKLCPESKHEKQEFIEVFSKNLKNSGFHGMVVVGTWECAARSSNLKTSKVQCFSKHPLHRNYCTYSGELSHLNRAGKANMVDVTKKNITPRKAVAECTVKVKLTWIFRSESLKILN